MYRFARCRKPLPITLMEAKGVPLPAEELEVLQANLRWDEIVVSGCVRHTAVTEVTWAAVRLFGVLLEQHISGVRRWPRLWG